MAVSERKKMSPQDESLWFKVRIELKITPETSESYKEFKIGVDRGFVTLEGEVASQDVAKVAERAALRVQGVTGVSNLLKTT